MISKKGSSFIEILIAIAILGIFATIYSSGLIEFKKVSERAININVADKEVLAIIESIRQDLGSHKINFVTGSAGLSQELDPDNLPFAWTKYGSVSAKDCESCQGRYGFTIQPISGFAGLYMATVRMNHTDWSKHRDFKFIVK